MTDYHWSELREQAVPVFGTYPNAQLESSIIEVFERSPAESLILFSM